MSKLLASIIIFYSLPLIVPCSNSLHLQAKQPYYITSVSSADSISKVQASSRPYSIVCNPAEDTRKAMNISWACDSLGKLSFVRYRKLGENRWSLPVYPETYRCTTFDSVYSKTPKGENFYERVIFDKCNAHLEGLKKNTRYQFQVIGQDTSRIYNFKTSGSKEWSACIISDYHAYTPLPKRLQSAMDMIDTIAAFKPVDWVLHLGDVCAWGGSYSFWKDMYTRDAFSRYMWAGLNGNHDDMDRTFKRSTPYFLRDANYFPRNGYNTQEGVCYFFHYSQTLFVMLNSEVMRSDEGLQEAQDWVRKVIRSQKSRYVIVCMHYQWFNGIHGSDSQYGRWKELFDQEGVDLALAGNNHIYIRTPVLYKDTPTSGKKRGTLYIQTPSADNERGQGYKDLTLNADKILYRWSEGPQTVGALHIQVGSNYMEICLLDRFGQVLDKYKMDR